MSKLWRSFFVAFVALMILLCVRSNEYFYDEDHICDCSDGITKVPKDIMTPFGFLYAILCATLLILGYIIEWPIRWLINKKIRKKFYIGNMYADTIVDKINLFKKGKFCVFYESPLIEQEKYVYYKYCIKGFTFMNKTINRNSEKEKLLANLIKLRDENHEHYLILKLARIK